MTEQQLKAKRKYQRLSDDAKKLVNYFCNSIEVSGLVLPDGFYFTKDPKAFIENMKDAERLVRTAPLNILFQTIDVCHGRSHPFWGKVPVLKLSTVIKAYNSLISDGTIRVVAKGKEKENGTEYGSKQKTF